MKHYDLAIVGAGIMGLAHAVHAARAGLSVAVFERCAEATGASVRNFGMLAVVAQRPGKQLDGAQRNLACWKQIAKEAGISIRQSGCLFLARCPEEMDVLAQSVGPATAAGHSLKLVTRDGLSEYTGQAPTESLLGGLWSPDAWKLDQRQAIAKIARWLQREYSVAFHFSTLVESVAQGVVETSNGAFTARDTILCGGDEFATIFPDAFRSEGVTRCQLQMLRTQPQPQGWRLKPFVLGGLSLTRYNVFEACSGLPALIEYQKKNLDRYHAHGIHVIASQEDDGSITIGDSHLYGDEPDAERSEEIDRLILEDLAGMIALPQPKIAERWLGHYAHLPGSEALVMVPTSGVTAVTMTNGQGMTHAFSVAEDVIQNLYGQVTR